jgi:hypothetical protein
MKHRLKNPGIIPLEVIEVQLGEYLKEDDIVRFNDDYGRRWGYQILLLHIIFWFYHVFSHIDAPLCQAGVQGTACQYQ